MKRDYHIKTGHNGHKRPYFLIPARTEIRRKQPKDYVDRQSARVLYQKKGDVYRLIMDELKFDPAVIRDPAQGWRQRIEAQADLESQDVYDIINSFLHAQDDCLRSSTVLKDVHWLKSNVVELYETALSAGVTGFLTFDMFKHCILMVDEPVKRKIESCETLLQDVKEKQCTAILPFLDEGEDKDGNHFVLFVLRYVADQKLYSLSYFDSMGGVYGKKAAEALVWICSLFTGRSCKYFVALDEVKQRIGSRTCGSFVILYSIYNILGKSNWIARSLNDTVARAFYWKIFNVLQAAEAEYLKNTIKAAT